MLFMLFMSRREGKGNAECGGHDGRTTWIGGLVLGLGLGVTSEVRLGLGGGSNVQRDRPQNLMAEANSDVPFHCDVSFSMHPSIEM